MKNILITGFEPFGGEKINPSYEALKLLPETIDNAKIHILRLPVIFGKTVRCLKKASMNLIRTSSSASVRPAEEAA